jgi:DNA modification methylase
MGEVPVIALDHLTAAQKRALVIADNKLALNAGWDDALLAIELAGLGDDGFDLSLLGFSDDELATLLADMTEGLTDPDDVPETPAEAVSVQGDVWVLGRHRLVCGDSTDADTVARCLDGVTPHLMVTDPPYGVEYDATWRGKAGLNPMGANRTGLVNHDDRADWREAWALFPGSIVYVWHGGLMSGVVAESLTSCGFALRSQIIWNKTVMAMSRGDYHWKHEPCWYAVRGTGHWSGDRKQTTVWDFASPIHIMGGSKEAKTPHPTQKPVECMKRPIENNSSPGQAVYDPFVGSGTTIIAGEMTGRAIHAIELNPAYVDVSILRWQAFTGKQATHEDGRLFDGLRGERDVKAAA